MVLPHSIFDPSSCIETKWLVDKSIQNTLSTLYLSVTFTLRDFNKTAAKQQCVHVRYSECAAVNIKGAVKGVAENG